MKQAIKTILLVEDDATNRKLVRIILGDKKRYRIVEAVGAKEALVQLGEVKPDLLLLDDPTKGVDVGTKAEFYGLLTKLCDEGKTILFYSSDDEELVGLCDRVIVLHDGKIHIELVGTALTKENLISASLGVANGGAQ